MTKFTYTTQEVADIVGISKKTLLNWLRNHNIPEPQRGTNNNYRIWTAEDIAFIQKVKKQLLKKNGG